MPEGEPWAARRRPRRSGIWRRNRSDCHSVPVFIRRLYALCRRRVGKGQSAPFLALPSRPRGRLLPPGARRRMASRTVQC
jgi:hypothetical protein